MQLYHGSTNHVKKPNVSKGRTSTDFGKGFYTTTNFEQAKSWACSKQKMMGADAVAIVNTYEVDNDLLKNKNFNTKSFTSPNSVWLSFVVDCRKEIPHSFDIVFGAVADDKIYTTITLFESKILTAAETVARLKVNEFYNQITFHSKEAVNQLTFISSSVVTTDSEL